MRPQDGMVFFAQAEKSFRSQYQHYVDSCIETLFAFPEWEELKNHRDLFRFQRDLFRTYLERHYRAEEARALVEELTRLGTDAPELSNIQRLRFSNHRVLKRLIDDEYKHFITGENFLLIWQIKYVAVVSLFRLQIH